MQQVKNILVKANWLARSMLWGFPIPATAEDWEYPNAENEAAMVEHFQRTEKAWNFLRPSFASRGYILYEKLRSFDLQPVIELGQISPPEAHPYGRRVHENDNARMSISVRNFTPCSWIINIVAQK